MLGYDAWTRQRRRRRREEEVELGQLPLQDAHFLGPISVDRRFTPITDQSGPHVFICTKFHLAADGHGIFHRFETCL